MTADSWIVPPGDKGGDTIDPIAAFADRLMADVEGVAAASAPPPTTLSFGPLAVDLRIVGDVFRQQLTRSIDFARSLTAEPCAATWRIIAVDGAASGLGAPPPWVFPATNRRHLERLHHAADRQLAVKYNPTTATWSVVCGLRHLAVIWTADAARLPEWDYAAPFRDLFHWMTLPTDCFLAHAAAIGVEGRGILLTGPGGAGKSTTVAAAALRGLTTAGDDFLLIDPRRPRAYALYDTVKLDGRSAEWLPELAALASNRDREPAAKALIHLSQVRPAAFARDLPISAVVLPRANGAERTTITPATVAEAMRAMVPSTICLIRGGEAETIRKSTAFLRGLPVYHCDLGLDPLAAIAVIGAFIADCPP